MAQHTERVRQHLAELLGPQPASALESAGPGVTLEASVSTLASDRREADLVFSGLQKLQIDSPLSDVEAQALEAIILPRERPVIDIVHDTFNDVPAPWLHLNEPERKRRIAAAIPSVGRIEIPNHPSAPYAGTGFVVGPGLIMTNRHVAETFSTGIGVRDLNFIAGRSPGIDFRQEVVASEPVVLQFARVVMIHPFWDCALIAVHGLPAGVEGLLLDGGEPVSANDGDVAVIGYPAQDSRNDLALQNRIFRGIYQRKRLQPGKLRQYGNVRSYANTVRAIRHDSSTLGGNSGSAVIDVETGLVVGLHFAGIYLESNYAVPTWELARDARIVDAGVNFVNRRDDAGPPPWHGQWEDLDRGIRPKTTRPRPSRRPENPLTGPDWYERTDDSMLAEALQRDFDATRAMLVDVLGEAEADAAIADLSDGVEEGLFRKSPDPELPEIIYLHGIMGGHLALKHGVGSRVWFNFLAFARGNIAEKMALGADGLIDRDPGIALAPRGHMRLKYAKASRRWRRDRFVVHEFTYDWRKPVATAADRLHCFIEQLATDAPGRRFALVGHSMGGLVSALYAKRHSGWSDRIERAVLVGSPLGGSYAPVEAVLGVYPFFRTLASLSRHDDIADLQALAVTLPGLLQMLPDPALFDDPLDYYSLTAWPGGPRPPQRWLDLSRNTKTEIASSPLLDRTTAIVSREFGTVASVRQQGRHLASGPRSGPGDGTVPIRAAAIEQLSELYEMTGHRHADMMRNDGVIAAVADLLRTGRTDVLPRLAISDIQFDEVLPEEEVPILVEAESAGLRERIEHGVLTQADIDFILDPIGHAAPR